MEAIGVPPGLFSRLGLDVGPIFGCRSLICLDSEISELSDGD